MVIRQTILQLKTPDHLRGRVASVNSIFVGSSNELGAFESGLTAKINGNGYRCSFWRYHHNVNCRYNSFCVSKFQKIRLN